MKRPLKHFSDEEIQQELAERTKEKDKVPQPLTNPDWSRLTALLTEGVNSVASEGYEPKDFEHWCFEVSVETLYGKDIWKWWNAHL